MVTINSSFLASQKISLDKLISLLIVTAICSYLTVRGLMNIVLILLFLIAVLYTVIFRNRLFDTTQTTLKWVSIFLAAPFTAVLIAQSLRMHYNWREFDAPLRLLLSIPVMWLLYWCKIKFTRLLFYTVPLSLLILILIIHFYPEPLVHWQGRFATYFVDCDTFGVYSMVLLAICIFFPYSNRLNFLSIWNIVGVLFGSYLVLESQTRAAWLNVPFIVALWLHFNFRNLGLSGLFKLFLVTIVIFLGVSHFSLSSNRLISAYTELSGWFSGKNTETSAGYRLTMWHMSWELFKYNPIFGYGNHGYMSLMNEPWITSISSAAARETISEGPHNEFLANLLRSGIFGGIAVLLEFFGTFIIFWRAKNANAVEIVEAAQLGVAIIVCLIISSLSFEVLTLKYTASFFGLMIAGLAAQIAWAQDNARAFKHMKQ